MSNQLDNPVFWFGALLGLYMWSFLLCTVIKIRQNTLEKYSLLIKEHPPKYNTLEDNNLPTYQEAVQGCTPLFA